MAHLANARVLLMGTGGHTERSGLPDIPAVSDTLADLRDVLVRQCEVSPTRIDLLLDPVGPVEMGDAVAKAAAAVHDVLFIYYVGHGLITPNGSLHLATARTDWSTTLSEHTALSYDLIRRYLVDSAARTTVVMLDCCFSGRALNTLGEAGDGIATLASVHGAFVLTSAGSNELALAPPGERHTAFTGELIRLLDQGDPDGPTEITLRYTFGRLAARLPAAGYPRPQYQSSGMAGDLVLAANAAHGPVDQLIEPPVESTPRTEQSAHRISKATGITIAVAVIVAAGIVATIVLIKSLTEPASGGPGSTATLPCKVTVTSDSLRVREAPDYNAAVVERLSLGAEIPAEKVVQNGFRKIGENRWVSIDYVRRVPSTDCG